MDRLNNSFVHLHAAEAGTRPCLLLEYPFLSADVGLHGTEDRHILLHYPCYLKKERKERKEPRSFRGSKLAIMLRFTLLF